MQDRPLGGVLVEYVNAGVILRNVEENRVLQSSPGTCFMPRGEKTVTL